MLINFYCTIIKQNIDYNPLIGKQQWIRFYVGMFVATSLICLKIVKYMKLKVAIKLLQFFHLFYICICIYVYVYTYIKNKWKNYIYIGLDGKGMQSHSHVPVHTILKTHKPNFAHLKYCMICFSLLLINSFPELLIMLLTLSKCSVCLDWTFYLVFFCHKVTFTFPHTYYLKHSSIHTAWNALQGFFLFVYGLYGFVYQFFDANFCETCA